jgi:oligopeptide transport system permease protein
MGVSVPAFVIALYLMLLFGVYLGLLPVVGLTSPLHYILPVAAQAFGPVATIARLTKSTYMEATQQDYVIMARAKGLSNFQIMFKHVLRNALIPVITYFGPAIAFTLTGSFVIEQVYSIPGIGREFTNAITNRDYTVILGFSVFIGALIIVANLVVDILCSIVDPRIKLTD